MSRARLKCIATLTLAISVVACGGSSSPQSSVTSEAPQSGTWSASMASGEKAFEFTVDGLEIPQYSPEFHSLFCGTATLNGSLTTKSTPTWKIKAQKFTVDDTFMTGSSVSVHVTINGTFDATGTHASGSWTVTANMLPCLSSNWQATPK